MKYNENTKSIILTTEEETELMNYLCDQIDTALKDRADMEQRWVKWIEQYEEILPAKTFPWKNASNVFIPLTSTHIETIHARKINAFFATKPYITISAKKTIINPDTGEDITDQTVQITQRFLDAILDELNAFDIISNWTLETDKMGTAYIKLRWNFGPQIFMINGEKTSKMIDKLEIDNIDINDLIIPANAKNNIESLPWIAHRVRANIRDLKKKEKLKIYSNIDKLEQYTTQKEDEVTAKKEEAEKIIRTSPEALGEYHIQEIWFDYDIDNDGYDEKLVGTIQSSTKTLLRLMYHPYNSNKYPFIAMRYMKRSNRWYGKGICEMLESLQDALNTVHNQRIDNATIANIKCFKARKGVKKDIPIDGIYPGWIGYFDDPDGDLKEFKIGDVNPSSFGEETILKDYAEKRTKVTDYTMGQESSIVKTRATATGTLALLQESGKHFDLIIRNSREAISELGYQIMELYQQNMSQGKLFKVLGEDGNFEFMELKPPELNLREDFDFYCTATSLSVNKEIEKQINILLLQQMTTIFDQIIKLSMMIISPDIVLPEELKTFMIGVVKSYYNTARRLLMSFEIPNIHSFLPDLPDLVKDAMQLQQTRQMQQMEQIQQQQMMGGVEQPMIPSQQESSDAGAMREY